MPFSHHSHSGQFCGHAENTLEEMVQTAIKNNMETFALTEHMPREARDLYPEEIKSAHTTATLSNLFHDYHLEALRLQKVYGTKIKLLIGMEIDWIRPSSKEFVENLLSEYDMNLFIGSVHHVHAVPIDYNRDLYCKAREMSGDSDEDLFGDYFDLQLDMLQALKPPIVGHFDLIRLLSDDPDQSFQRRDVVWQKILRNLDFIGQYGGIVELNSAAWRKGLREPYPKVEICKEFVARGGRFAVSDDSHSISQVGTNYAKFPKFFKETGISSVVFLTQGPSTRDSRFPNISAEEMSVANLRDHTLFT